MIALGADHGAYALKEKLKEYLDNQGYSYRDLGCYSEESCDYPAYGRAVGEAVARGDCSEGIVLCTTGIGISIAANKVNGIRCALCCDSFSAEMARRHNNANVLALGAGITGVKLAERIVDVFLKTEFEGGRHGRRVQMISDME